MPPVDLAISLGEGANATLDQAQLTGFLENVQGGILRGHGRNYSRFLLLELPRDAGRARAALAAIADGRLTGVPVTTAAQQMTQSARYKAALLLEVASPTESVQLIWVTAAFAARVGMPHPSHAPFQEGMAARRALINDPLQHHPDSRYQKADVVVAVSSDDEGMVERAAAEAGKPQSGELQDVKLLHAEACAALRSPEGLLEEPFGFADGISDLDFWKAPAPGATSDPSAPLSQVLVSEATTAGFGSFVVMRKLEQDVSSFETAVHQIAQAVYGTVPTAAQIDKTAGQMIGRSRDGTALAKLQGTARNVFDYGSDPSGRVCPLFAHVRKANPRGGSRFESLEEERSHRIARRGIPLDPRGGNTGLMFICFQSDIARQFEFVQKTWTSNPDFPRPGAGSDILSGTTAARTWPRPGGPPIVVTVSAFIRLLAGAYLYAPSPAALRHT